MLRLPPALWLLGLALCVSNATRDPGVRRAPAPVAAAVRAGPDRLGPVPAALQAAP
jgi:hypothetical protein